MSFRFKFRSKFCSYIPGIIICPSPPLHPSPRAAGPHLPEGIKFSQGNGGQQASALHQIL